MASIGARSCCCCTASGSTDNPAIHKTGPPDANSINHEQNNNTKTVQQEQTQLFIPGKGDLRTIFENDFK